MGDGAGLAVGRGGDRRVRVRARRTRSRSPARTYFPGLETAAQAGVVHVTSNILARPEDDTCVLNAELLAAAAEGACAEHRYNAVVLRSPVVIDDVTLDVSPLVLPVLDTDGLRPRHTGAARRRRRRHPARRRALQPADLDGDRSACCAGWRRR